MIRYGVCKRQTDKQDDTKIFGPSKWGLMLPLTERRLPSATGRQSLAILHTYKVATNTELANTNLLHLRKKKKSLISVELTANGTRLIPEETSPDTRIWSLRHIAVS